jgi:hypothetical protein
MVLDQPDRQEPVVILSLLARQGERIYVRAAPRHEVDHG